MLAKKITYERSRSCSLCQSSVDYGNTKITQHAPEVPKVFRVLKLDTKQKKKKKEKNNNNNNNNKTMTTTQP